MVKTRFSEKCFNRAERGRAAFAEAQGKGRDSRGGITFPCLRHLWVYQVCVCVGVFHPNEENLGKGNKTGFMALFQVFYHSVSSVKVVIGVGLKVSTSLPTHNLQQTCKKLVKLQTHCGYESL